MGLPLDLWQQRSKHVGHELTDHELNIHIYYSFLARSITCSTVQKIFSVKAEDAEHEEDGSAQTSRSTGSHQEVGGPTEMSHITTTNESKGPNQVQQSGQCPANDKIIYLN